ncbi:MAG: SgcJ/EcaC family oxidoreductase [Pseudonocardiaceae bacterium]
MNRHLLAAMGIGAAVAAGVSVLASVGSSQVAAVPAAAWPGSCAAEQDAIRAVPRRIVTGWAANDADAVAAVFTTDTDFVIGDGTFLRGREELRQYMADVFDGFLKESRVTAPVESVRCLSPTAGVVHTLGGILLPGETEVPPERQGVQVFVVTKHGGEWLVDVYQNTRIDQNTRMDPPE